MRRWRNGLVFLFLSGLTMAGTGCVQQSKYDELLSANRSLKEQIVAAEDERDAAVSQLDTIQDQLASARGDLNRLEGSNRGLRGELDSMSGRYGDLQSQVMGLQIGPLPEDLSNALSELAQQYPNVLSFDARSGLLRFASDFTFALSSADLSADASSTLTRLAEILQSPAARGFEVKVVGHTDDVPIGKPDTRAKHPTNVHLSVHRSISVRDALVRSGVEPTRVQVAGYGEFRPVVENTRGGTAANRRVEIYLQPMPDMPMYTGAAATQGSTRSAIVQPETEEPMK